MNSGKIEDSGNARETAVPGSAERELIKLGFADAAFMPLLQANINHFRAVTYEPNDTLYHEGDSVDALYIIRSGLVKLVNHLDNGRTRIVRLHNRSSIMGLSGLLDQRHEHTAVAVRETSIFQFPIRLIQTLKSEQPEFGNGLMEKWHRYLADADTWITEFSTGGIRGRTARLIRFLCDMDDEVGEREAVLLTSEEIGEILGVTPESASRVVADFKRKSILKPSDTGLANTYRCDLSLLNKEAQG
jgi:CRP/FNR family transcriptional regulator